MGEREIARRRVDGVGATVLGAATVDGEAPTQRQRAIIAALALHRGTGASTDCLVDAVWGEQVPGSARQSLQNHIARLRARFGVDVVLTGPAGYRLGRTTDVERFEADVAPWVGPGAPPASIEALERGLRLWRGEPYLDLADSPVVEPERARLSELQAAGAEQLASARLTAGDAATAAAELAALTEADPYRERRWELLMLALDRDGRRTEALAAFDRAAARFALDLRTRPSARLQQLRARIAGGEVIRINAVDLLTRTTGPDARSAGCRSTRPSRLVCHRRSRR